MLPFDENRYVPVLFTKRSELNAVGDLPSSIKDAMTPVFVVHPQEVDFDSGGLKKSMHAHVEKLPKALVDAWGTGGAFIDLVNLSDEPMSDGSHPLVWLLRECATLGLDLTPVVSPDRSTNYLASVVSLLAGATSQVAFRLTANQWPGSTGPASVDALLRTLGLQASDVHVLLDIEGEAGNTAYSALSAELRLMPTIQQWTSLTVVGSSRPAPANLPGKGIHEMERVEWTTYKRIRNGLPPRIPSFGDYGIAAIETVSVDPRVMSIAGKITYTVEDISLFAKGELFKGQAGSGIGGDSVVEPCRLVSLHRLFLGRGHCLFEGWIEDVANRSVAGSSPGTWLRHGTHHHLIHSVEQIASLPSASTSP
ncbi:hypothetical protein HQO84_18590 [Rhodococcus fascians]|nr:hypothetical protein [Rhodococcus fascians]MBY3999294.1 hypothetical protein [Rhodococcus fascians]MBY4003797.1 hypothetical protein [Rhodococcus fascians]MBY4009775.1 hypothetical protein [Rhodococcus fascians]MBY4018544.1 hypothetical protein [Rhodococcus fascians]